jgi:hypothetical protein
MGITGQDDVPGLYGWPQRDLHVSRLLPVGDPRLVDFYHHSSQRTYWRWCCSSMVFERYPGVKYLFGLLKYRYTVRVMYIRVHDLKKYEHCYASYVWELAKISNNILRKAFSKLSHSWQKSAFLSEYLKKCLFERRNFLFKLVVWRQTTAKAFVKNVFIHQERKLEVRRRLDTALVLTINDIVPILLVLGNRHNVQ